MLHIPPNNIPSFYVLFGFPFFSYVQNQKKGDVMDDNMMSSAIKNDNVIIYMKVLNLLQKQIGIELESSALASVSASLC